MKMKKLFIKLLLFIVVLACAGPFILKDKNGRPLMTVDKIKLPHLSMPDIKWPSFFSKKQSKPASTEILAEDSIVPEEGQEVEKFYTYKDDKGVVHFTDQKPNLDNYKVIYLPKSKENSKGSLEKIKDKISSLTDKKPGSSSKDSGKESAKTGLNLSLPGPYSQVGKTIEDAKNLKGQVEKSYQERERMMNP